VSSASVTTVVITITIVTIVIHVVGIFMFLHTKRETGNGKREKNTYNSGLAKGKRSWFSHWSHGLTGSRSHHEVWKKRTFGAKRLSSDASGIVTSATITRICLRFRAVPDSVRKGV
jgi:hypothetical protein